MKNTKIAALIWIVVISIFTSCGKEDDPVAQIVCNTFDEGKNAILDAQEKDLKCVYGVANYNLIQDSFGDDGESIRFEFDREFYVTFVTYDSYYDEAGTYVNESNGIFEIGKVYEADARTGNATFFSPAKLEITNIDKDNELISGKITSEAPIRWVDATPVMGYVIFTFTDLKI